ncbi:helix-turn-helix transcriptional regulator [Microbacterium sp. T32]|uniref:helix-turn-helix transcriptional regulator n=1 Tax=Microbacterium sp. T32 TaxID=1776083 RepID=UPI0007ABAAD6|nr:helix-turn-helix domain-containing protein [Microbacterium sp. T32]KZE33090.1 hypothetical protein AVW09_06825 [Microbacterium sp. T32]
MATTEGQTLRVSAVAEALGISDARVRRLIQRGDLAVAGRDPIVVAPKEVERCRRALLRCDLHRTLDPAVPKAWVAIPSLFEVAAELGLPRAFVLQLIWLDYLPLRRTETGFDICSTCLERFAAAPYRKMLGLPRARKTAAGPQKVAPGPDLLAVGGAGLPSAASQNGRAS